MLIWILLGVGAYVLLALVVGRFLGGGALRRIRDEILEEALPSAATGRGRSPEDAQAGFRWTEAVNLTADDRFRSPAAKRDAAHRESETETAGAP